MTEIFMINFLLRREKEINVRYEILCDKKLIGVDSHEVALGLGHSRSLDYYLNILYKFK